MTRLLPVLFFVCCIAGCSRSDKPKDILPEMKMENVIWDMVQADEFIQGFVLKDSNTVNVNAERYKLYEQVFKMHNTNKAQFKKSYEYYTAHPSLNKKIFDSLAVRANRRMQDVYKNAK